MDELRRNLEGLPGQGRRSPLFRLGLVTIGERAREALATAYEGSRDPAHVEPYLARHQAADWNDLDDHEREANLSAIENGHAITGRFYLPGANGARLLIVTAAEGPARQRLNTTVDATEVQPCRK